MRAVAIVVVLALVLPVVIGTAVIVWRAFQDDSDVEAPTNKRAAIAPFGTVGFRVGDDPTTYCALLADTQATHQQGMQNRSDLGGYDAMVFAFAQDETVNFTNHFVPIDLDIGWYDARGALVDFTTMDKCPEGVNCPVYASKDPFRYAVETPVGGLSGLGLTGSGATLHVGGSC